MSTAGALSRIPRRWLGVLICVPLVLSLLFYALTIAAEEIDVSLIANQNLNSCVEQLGDLAKDAQAGERGFIITGQDAYLRPLQHANATLATQVRACAHAADGRPAEIREQIFAFIDVVQKRLAQANRIVSEQRAHGARAAIEDLKINESEATADDIRRRAGNLERSLGEEQSDFRDKQRKLTRTAYLIFLFGTLALLAVMLSLYSVLLSYLHDRDAANAELQRVNAELESRIEDRTKDLTRANEELRQFAYVASHDLQEPLRTITSFTQLLETRYKGQLDQDADEFMDYIVAAARRMTDLINGLLALGRLRKAGQGTAPVSFNDLLREAEISLQAAIRESGAEIISGPLPSLVVDGVQFAQVLQNLISNAIKYRRDERPRVVIRAERDSSNWIFSVSDNGRGFDQKFAERIFGLFQRLHPREVSGTGMGLSIARGIVERHGGRIWAESKEGQGSAFLFTLHPATAAVTA
jgi:signal transduction histidine kinase